MSKNCLVTKLKGTVNNPDLEKLGTIVIGFPANSATNNKSVSISTPRNDSSYVDTPLIVKAVEYPLVDRENVQFTERGIPYWISATTVQYQIPQFKTTSDEVTHFEVYNYYIAANFIMPGMLAKFDIMRLQYCINALIMRFWGTEIFGDVWALFDGMVAQGRTSGTMRYSFNPTYCEHAPGTSSEPESYVTFTNNTTTYPRGWYLSDDNGNPLT